ncbi:SdpI family protein [Fodinibius salsisoli]|uniref:SdpI family protein n=1 Tax=Fodinibius salsisoli TaxID=2820877 RepID=A0ABT3PLC9_9BACT|nr:SdpI family protein [Fodinibius salsisoli]MCW9706014.1 SdpI family protein [Fodinibius salsisoli]
MKTLKYALKYEWYNLLLLLLPFIVIPFIWDLLPAQLPTHWNWQGEIDGYSSRITGLLILPLINIGVYALLLYLPVIDPKKRITVNQKPIPVLRTLMVVLLTGIHGWVIFNGLGTEIQSQGWLYLVLAVFFLVMGNYLRTIKPNYFIGIRVPWALENAENWKETHRLGSYVWVAGGLSLILLFPFLPLQTYATLFTVVVIALALIPAVYSFYLYKTQS